ncbi:hypothetical protein BSL78_13277 [Apostichopus japonicus]|uniref:Uncharacterized protein n=1 Tax=Stichopus japonicus TaxID=307972 RepID=A0A2G8KP96_STIJA|nr:hypothetical protein BSL78_13277 [Apostichopus japonicus]
MNLWNPKKQTIVQFATTSSFQPVPYRAEPCQECVSLRTCLNNEFRNFDRDLLKRVTPVVYDAPPSLSVINTEKRIHRQERARSSWKKGKTLSVASMDVSSSSSDETSSQVNSEKSNSLNGD